jgi:hypothetical protein
MTTTQIQNLAEELAKIGVLIATAAGAPAPALATVNALIAGINLLKPQIDELFASGKITVEQQQEVNDQLKALRVRLGIPEPSLPLPHLAPPTNPLG